MQLGCGIFSGSLRHARRLPENDSALAAHALPPAAVDEPFGGDFGVGAVCLAAVPSGNGDFARGATGKDLPGFFDAEAAAVACGGGEGFAGGIGAEHAQVVGGEAGELAAGQEAAGLGLHIDVVAGAVVEAAVVVADGEVGLAVEVVVAHLDVFRPQAAVVEGELIALESLGEAAVAQGNLCRAHADEAVAIAGIAMHFGLPARRQIGRIHA